MPATPSPFTSAHASRLHEFLSSQSENDLGAADGSELTLARSSRAGGLELARLALTSGGVVRLTERWSRFPQAGSIFAARGVKLTDLPEDLCFSVHLLSGSGLTLHDAIQAADVTLPLLSAHVGVSVPTMQRYSNGSREPSVTHALRIAQALGRDVNEIHWGHGRSAE